MIIIKKWELATTIFISIFFGFMVGIVFCAGQLPKQRQAEVITLPDIFTIDYYILYDSEGKKVGYQRIDFEGIYYSTDGHNWTDEPIPWVRKEKFK